MPQPVSSILIQLNYYSHHIIRRCIVLAALFHKPQTNKTVGGSSVRVACPRLAAREEILDSPSIQAIDRCTPCLFFFLQSVLAPSITFRPLL
jgi:hypothetical protein